MAKEKKLIPAPLDEKNVTTDFIETDIYNFGECVERIRKRTHRYVGFRDDMVLEVEYNSSDNYLHCHFDNPEQGATLRLKEWMEQMNTDENSNVMVTTDSRSIHNVLFRFWFKEDE